MTTNAETETPGQRPIQEGLFTWPSERPQLIASHCQNCGELTFPSQDSCPACTARNSEEVLLSRRGTLWTWTVQHFPSPAPPYIGPSDPDEFTPFAVGYVELPEGIRVEGHLTESDADRLEIGMEMDLVIEPFVQDEEGCELMRFAFRPASD